MLSFLKMYYIITLAGFGMLLYSITGSAWIATILPIQIGIAVYVNENSRERRRVVGAVIRRLTK